MAKKKFTAILLAAVMAFAVCAFTGCNSGDDEFTEKNRSDENANLRIQFLRRFSRRLVGFRQKAV